jgi:hypothetical protein
VTESEILEELWSEGRELSPEDARELAVAVR